MPVIPVNRLKSGMVLASTIVTKRGQTIAKSGTILDRKLISKLTFYSINEVEVVHDFTTDEKYNDAPAPTPIVEEVPVVEKEVLEPAPEPAPVVEEKKPVEKPDFSHGSYSTKLKSTAEYQSFQVNYSSNMATLQTMFKKIEDGEMIDEKELLKEPKMLFQSKTSLELFDMIHGMRSLDDTVYAHCLNVALISRAIGRWLKLPKEELDTLTVAALLHDIGKIQIPDEILNKTGKLTDEEFSMMRSHAINGKKILQAAGYPPKIQFAALQHHERSDGTGYPRGLEDDEISDFAAIIAIADVYDAMTASRSYRTAKCPFQVIAAFEDEGLKKYHTKYILTFLEHVAATYLNSHVMLNDGRSAKVVYINKSKLSKPLVQLEGGDVIDLIKETDLYITKIM